MWIITVLPCGSRILKKGKYRAKEAEEKVTENFLDAFTHNIANCVDAQFNNANKVLEADTKELRISIIHDSVAATGTSVCIRRSPCLVRNTINGMLNSGFCEEKVLHLLLNCVRAGMNFVFGGEPGAGKNGNSKVFYAVYSERKPCDHDRGFFRNPLSGN